VTLAERRHRFRLRVFALARELGNARAACRAPGMHPSTYYRWRRQLRRFGPEPAFARSLIPTCTGPRLDLDRDVRYDNTDRAHTGRWTRGRPPDEVLGEAAMWAR
jgi:transposase-like protein